MKGIAIFFFVLCNLAICTLAAKKAEVDSLFLQTGGSVTAVDALWKTAPQQLFVNSQSPYLHLKFAILQGGVNIAADQAMLSLINGDNEQISFWLESSDELLYVFNMHLGEEMFNRGVTLSGEYRLSLVIGGETISNPQVVDLGILTITGVDPVMPSEEYDDEEDEDAFEMELEGDEDLEYEEEDDDTPVLQQARREERILEDKVSSHVEDEIKHEFGTPARRPSRMFSDMFTILVLLPWVFLVGMLVVSKAGVGGFPRGVGFVYATGFNVGLASIAGTIVLYWLRLTIFEAGLRLLILAPVTVVLGVLTFRSLEKRDSEIAS